MIKTNSHIKPSTSPYVEVRTSKIHGTGIFAQCDIPKGARIIEYVGERITKAEAERRASHVIDRHKKNEISGAVYIFELNKRHDIDGDVPYNTARYINHSCDPNAEVDIIRGKIWIIALRDIAKGTEIFYNYGYEFDGVDEHRCHCKADRCVGYILAEEHWPKLKKAMPNAFERNP
jgi:SET domain-containing protein